MNNTHCNLFSFSFVDAIQNSMNGEMFLQTNWMGFIVIYATCRSGSVSSHEATTNSLHEISCSANKSCHAVSRSVIFHSVCSVVSGQGFLLSLDSSCFVFIPSAQQASFHVVSKIKKCRCSCETWLFWEWVAITFSLSYLLNKRSICVV